MCQLVVSIYYSTSVSTRDKLRIACGVKLECRCRVSWQMRPFCWPKRAQGSRVRAKQARMRAHCGWKRHNWIIFRSHTERFLYNIHTYFRGQQQIEIERNRYKHIAAETLEKRAKMEWIFDRGVDQNLVTLAIDPYCNTPPQAWQIPRSSEFNTTLSFGMMHRLARLWLHDRSSSECVSLRKRLRIR